jgi:hypothetical protein
VRACSKLIGARYFNKGYTSAAGVPANDRLNTPRDDVGHGTHTLATAGGSAVRGANAFGYGNGTARGGSPLARVAAYRVCFNPAVNDTECFDADILAAFEAAISDGVHIITASVGGDPKEFLEDVVAIGSLHAVKAGITVVCSAGNNGPDFGTVANLAPWVVTVAASTTDRGFPAYVVFNRTRAEGQSLSETWLRGKGFYPMIVATDAVAPNKSADDAYARTHMITELHQHNNLLLSSFVDALQSGVRAGIPGPGEGEGEDRGVRERTQPQDREGRDRPASRRRRNGSHQRRGRRNHRHRRPARSPSSAHQLHRRARAPGVHQIHPVSRFSCNVYNESMRHNLKIRTFVKN